jgi:hypothetical protein
VRLSERHKNGAFIDVDGEPDRIVAIITDWRKYQDMSDRPKVIGFKAEEVKIIEGSS